MFQEIIGDPPAVSSNHNVAFKTSFLYIKDHRYHETNVAFLNDCSNSYGNSFSAFCQGINPLEKVLSLAFNIEQKSILGNQFQKSTIEEILGQNDSI